MLAVLESAYLFGADQGSVHLQYKELLTQSLTKALEERGPQPKDAQAPDPAAVAECIEAAMHRHFSGSSILFPCSLVCLREGQVIAILWCALGKLK